VGKGLKLSDAVLPGLLAARVVLVPPPGLVATATVTATAASGSALAGSSAAVVKGAILMTASTKLTLIAGAVSAAILLVGGAVATTMMFMSPSKPTVAAVAPGLSSYTPTPVVPGLPQMSGRVLGADGTPVGGATVFVAPAGPTDIRVRNGQVSGERFRAVTGADGVYHLPLQTGVFHGAGAGGCGVRAGGSGRDCEESRYSVDAVGHDSRTADDRLPTRSRRGIAGILSRPGTGAGRGASFDD